MLRSDLEGAVSETRKILADAITSSSYEGKLKKDGQEAKNAAIRSSQPIQKLHSILGISIEKELHSRKIKTNMWPPSGSIQPELKITGLLKAKKQDIAITVKPHIAEKIQTGVQVGEIDHVGFEATNSALAIGVRSQLSSIEKNFDTLSERSFAETLNLRLRCPKITLAEAYLIPIYEFNDFDLKNNKIGFNNKKVDVEKFIRIFNAITQQNNTHEKDSLYKYNATTLIIADMRDSNVRILWDQADFIEEFGEQIALKAKQLYPSNFIKQLCDSYEIRLETK